jgi:F420H(2)-dependent quinone reductase
MSLAAGWLLKQPLLLAPTLPTLSGKVRIPYAEFPRYRTGAALLYWQQRLPVAQEINGGCMKIFLKLVLSIYVFLYRLTSGAIGGQMAGLQVLLLTTTGRKTGQRRTTPLGYFKQDGNFVLIASNAGADRNPAWFYNLKSNPQVAIQIGNRQMAAHAEQADPEKRTQLWTELVKLAPAYAQYSQRTKREIPMVIVQPI